ncbi:phage holin family protein [Conexibacter woesei]|uniref:phage holin family protein n=1 Tax=Conexibacter woesei TaxID=191495 RepID=UPI000410A51A|nr:phage holin family protein [Conexibacter woesei]
MTPPPNDPQQPASIVQAIQEISEKAQILVREEIELAKVEITEKVTRLGKGAAIAAAAGIFVGAAMVMILFGLAWLAYWAIPFPDGQYFWGFFTVAAILLLLAALAGYIAYRALQAGSPPAPKMAIEEAKLIKETVQAEHPETTL